jgi:ketosteroid isomerase-like protein
LAQASSYRIEPPGFFLNLARRDRSGTRRPKENTMAELSRDEARALIEGALASLLNPREDVADLSRYFAPDYIQDVDGKRLDYAGFIDHARALKTHLRGGRVTIETLLVDGDTIADIHVIEAENTNGGSIRTKVIAFFTVRDGKIVRVDELTHLLHGAEEDRDMGSRT